MSGPLEAGLEGSGFGMIYSLLDGPLLALSTLFDGREFILPLFNQKVFVGEVWDESLGPCHHEGMADSRNSSQAPA